MKVSKMIDMMQSFIDMFFAVLSSAWLVNDVAALIQEAVK